MHALSNLPLLQERKCGKYLETNRGADRMKLVSQVATGLAYLHCRNVIHGDMKASNILVNDEHEACIADFGLSRILGESGFTTKSVAGTCRWMAYELVELSDEEDESIPQVTMASDIWAFGMTVLEMLSGRLPFFYLKRDLAVIRCVMRGDQPKHEKYTGIGGGIWSMLELCWNSDPTQRPSMEFLVLHLI